MHLLAIHLLHVPSYDYILGNQHWLKRGKPEHKTDLFTSFHFAILFLFGDLSFLFSLWCYLLLLTCINNNSIFFIFCSIRGDNTSIGDGAALLPSDSTSECDFPFLVSFRLSWRIFDLSICDDYRRQRKQSSTVNICKINIF